MRTTLILQAVLLSVALVVVGLGAWQQAQDLVLDHWVAAARPDLAAWAVRSGAIAAVALAQAILAGFVVGRVFQRGRFDAALAIVGTIVFAAASVGAIACGLAAR